MGKINRKEYAESLKERHKESYDTKDDSGKFKSIFKTFPNNIKVYKIVNEEHFVNIVPWRAGKKHPKVPAGKPTYIIDLFVHRGIGASEDSFVCMARTKDKNGDSLGPCAVCEDQNEMRKSGDYSDEDIKALNASRRAIYLIECLDSEKEQEKGLQVLDISHFKFEKELDEQSKKRKGGGFIYFSDPSKEEGRVIGFTVSNAGKMTMDISGMRLLERDEEIPDELLEKTFPIDEYINWPTYDEVYKAHFGVEAEEKEETSEEEGEGDVGDYPSDEGQEGSEEGEGEEATEEGGEEGGETEEQEEKQRPAPKYKCPAGGTFGDDCDLLEDCSGCRVWEKCNEKKKSSAPPPSRKPVKKEEKPAPKKEEKKEEKKPSGPVKRTSASTLPVRRRPGR